MEHSSITQAWLDTLDGKSLLEMYERHRRRAVKEPSDVNYSTFRVFEDELKSRLNNR